MEVEMAEKVGMTDGLFGISPDVYPGYLQLPAPPETTPMPYSPEGWQASKFATSPEEGTTASVGAAKGEKKTPVSFTPEQALALQKLTSVQPAAQHAAAGGRAAPQNHVGQMAQLSPGQAGQGTQPRASLGQILYGGRKF